MAQLTSIPQSTEQVLQYNNLLGVDFQSDVTEVNRRRSPDMVNMISDLGGKPIKRNGYRRIGPAYLGYCIVDGKDWVVKKVDEKICVVRVEVDENGVLIELSDTQAEVTDNTSFGDVNNVFGMNTSIYIMCENGWLEYDTYKKETSHLSSLEGLAWNYSTDEKTDFDMVMPKEKFIPTVATLLLPDGTMAPIGYDVDLTGALDGVNILTPFRIYEYQVTKDVATKTEFTIPNVSAMSGKIKVEVLDSATLNWTETLDYTTTKSADETLTKTPDGKQYSSVFTYSPKIVFNSAPYTTASIGGTTKVVFKDKTDQAVPEGNPNVRITIAPFNAEELEMHDGESIKKGFYNEKRNDLFKSNIFTLFNSRLLVGMGVHTYYSRSGNPYKMDDNFYFDIDNNVVAYARTSYSLAIISEETGKSTIYLASSEYNSVLGMTAYTVKASNANVGAISSKCQGLFSDEPVFLSKSGVYGIQTNLMSDKYAVNRSGKINRRLCKEPNLENAVGISFNGYFYIYINNSMYILDSRHKEESRSGDKGYECYYFDNMPNIKSMFVAANRMFFIDDENTYTWNDDLEEQYKYLDNAVFNTTSQTWQGNPVKARWSSSVDSDGMPMYYKTLNKKGTMVTLIPNLQTSCEITLIKDGNEQFYLGQFDGTTFSLSDAALDAFTRKKIKKYKRLQFIIENNEAEPFGITNISKVYTVGNLAKR